MIDEQSDRPLVSVVMSTYREVSAPAPCGEAGSMLRRAIGSVIAQSYPNWELLIISDHPPPREREAIENLIASFGDGRIYYEDLGSRAGLSALGAGPKRRGVERSHGALLAFLDADNAFEPEHLGRCVPPFDGSDAVDLVYGDTRVILDKEVEDDDLGRQFITFLYKLVGAEALEKEFYPLAVMGKFCGASFTWEKPSWDAAAARKLASLNFIDVSDPVMRRTAYDAAGGIKDLPYLSDWRLWLDMIQAGHNRFRHVPHVGLRYTTTSLVQHQRYYWLNIMEKLNLHLDMAKLQEQAPVEIDRELRRKHDGVHRVEFRENNRPRVLFIGEAAAISWTGSGWHARSRW